MKKSFRSVIAGAVALALFAVNPASLSPMPANAATSFADHQLENYPCYIQGDGNCWAVTAATMYSYKSGSACYSESMYSKFHDVYGYYPSNSEGITIAQAKGLLKHVFEDWRPGTYEVNMYLSALTQNTISAQIDNDMPVYINGYRYKDGKKVGHAVALVGYKKCLADGNVYGVYQMNPQYGEVLYAPYAEGSTYIIKTKRDDVVYTWDQSVTIF